MQNQFAPYLSQQLSALMQQAAQTMATAMAQQMAAQMAAYADEMGTQLSQSISSQLSSQMSGLSESLANGFHFDANAFAIAIQFNMTQEDLASLMTNYMNSEELTYDNNLTKLGYADKNSPETISIYPVDFPAKEKVMDLIDAYNSDMTAAGDDDLRHPVHRSGGHADELGHQHREHHQHRADRIRGHLAGGQLDHDRHHHVHLGARTPKRRSASCAPWALRS